MKKTLLSLTLLTSIGIYSAQAQITVDLADVVAAGDAIEQAQDTISNGITIGSSGANQTWDFSSLHQDELDTLFFMDASPSPGNSNFPLSNLVMQESSDDSSWVFLTKDASGFFMNGLLQLQQDGSFQAVNFASTLITFPSTMGTNFVDSWNGVLIVLPVDTDPDGPGPTPIIDSVKITRASSLSSNIDAWGDVTTPFGTFASLRQVVEDQTIDTTWTASGGSGVWEMIDPVLASLFNLDQIAYDTTRTARWWTNNPISKFPIVEMDYEDNGTVNNIDWQKSTLVAAVTEQSVSVSTVSLSPNPAKTEVTIKTDLTNNNTIKILDITGKLIVEKSFNTSQITLPVSAFNNGIYFYNILDVNGNLLHSNKFVVSK
jgi:hypothetical protein